MREQFARRMVSVFCVVAFGLVLASCDKCGNSIFRVSGPMVCKDERPR